MKNNKTRGGAREHHHHRPVICTRANPRVDEELKETKDGRGIVTTKSDRRRWEEQLGRVSLITEHVPR